MERIMSDEMSAGKSSAAKALTLEEIKSFIPARDPESNKGSYGKLFVIAGSSGMSGAAFFAALSAYRAGTGLVKLFTHSDNRIILQTQLPEAILLDYSEKEEALQKLQMSIHWAHDILIGPGIGTDTLSCAILKQTLQLLLSEDKEQERIILLDADALNILSLNDELMNMVDLLAATTQKQIIITPHPMEMMRLQHQNITVSEILADPVDTARNFSEKHHLITVMKCSHSAVSNESGRNIYQSASSCPALAKGGSGDVLAGCIMGLVQILRNTKPIRETPDFLAFLAASAGVAVHVAAGHRAAEKYGTHGVLARDVADEIGRVLDLYHEN